MNIPDTIIRYDKRKDTQNHLTGTIRATLLDNEQQVFCSQDGATKQEALEKLLQAIQQMIQEMHEGPVFIPGVKETAVVYRRCDGWWYGFYGGKTARTNLTSSDTSYPTRQMCERAARSHLAQKEWDGYTLTSSLIGHPDDQAEFTNRCTRSIKIRVLMKLGWTHMEADWVVDGLAQHMIPLARYEEMPPMPEAARQMRVQAWLILEHFAEQAKAKDYNYCAVSLTPEDLGTLLGGDDGLICLIDVQRNPQNSAEEALRELFDQGILEPADALRARIQFALPRKEGPASW